MFSICLFEMAAKRLHVCLPPLVIKGFSICRTCILVPTFVSVLCCKWILISVFIMYRTRKRRAIMTTCICQDYLCDKRLDVYYRGTSATHGASCRDIGCRPEAVLSTLMCTGPVHVGLSASRHQSTFVRPSLRCLQFKKQRVAEHFQICSLSHSLNIILCSLACMA